MDMKSKSVYDRWFDQYKRYCDSHVKDFVLYGSFFYFIGHLSHLYKCSTIWQAASCINKYMKVCHNVNFMGEESFKLFMKKLGKNHVPLKSAVFTLDDVVACIEKDELNITVKVALIIGVFGGCRTQELVDMCFDDIVYEAGVYKVLIAKSKTDPAGVGHSFYVSPSCKSNRKLSPLIFASQYFLVYYVVSGVACPVMLIRTYIDCFTVDCRFGRFFRMVNNGKATSRPIGKNLLAKYPRMCAEALGKPSVKDFTGHAFRRTSATIVADSGASMVALKRHGRWKSDKVAEGYVAESKTSKMIVSSCFSGGKETESVEVKSTGFNLTHCHFQNCVVNFNQN